MTKLAIVGAGAIGQLIASQLSSTFEIQFITRRTNFDSQWQVETASQQRQQYSAPVITAADDLQQFELVIVCVKAYQVVDAVLPLLDKLNPHCHILLLHNGMGPHLTLMAHIGERGLSLGTTSQGALLTGPQRVTHTGLGLTQFGHLHGKPLNASLKQQLLAAIPQSQWHPDIINGLWQKLAINAAINPLTAIEQCKNGQLTASTYNQHIDQIVTELHQVATSDNIALDKTALLTRIYDVIQLTANNYSSMYQDIAHQRRTEIDYINGYIVTRAQQHQLDVPFNLALVTQIKKLEKKS